MNKDQVKGRTTEVAGKIQEVGGTLTGDKRERFAGTIKKNNGKTQAAVGDVKKDLKHEK